MGRAACLLHYRKQSFLSVEKVFVYLLIKGKEKINEVDFLDWSECNERNGEV